jgi:hypothetical protein
MTDRRFAGLPILIETEKTNGLHKPNQIAIDPLDARNLDTLRSIRGAGHGRPAGGLRQVG